MSAELHSLSFPGALLARGFWLYVWEVVTSNGKTVLYVGRTGDSASIYAQSPFTRMSQHLGSNKHANALRRHLRDHNIDPNTCRSFEMIAYGPILPEATSKEVHRERRDKIAALEKALADGLSRADYTVINEVKCRKPLDEVLWSKVREAFAARFERLGLTTMSAAAGEVRS